MAIVYEHLRNDTNEVFYVGMGEEEGRAYVKYGRNPHWKNIVNKAGYTVNIIYKDIEHQEAKKIEILLIEKYGRKDLGTGNLVNRTDGGEGLLNPSIETRQKIREGNKGKTQSEEARQKISEGNKGNTNMLGKTHSEEARKKIGESKKGNKNPNFGKTHSEEARKKISEGNKGKIVLEETRKKISEGNKGKIVLEETRKKIGEASKGKIVLEETRKKISEGNKGKTQSEEARKKIGEANRNRKGVKGYYFNKISKKWIAKIGINKKSIFIGSFDTPEEAAEAYQKARLIYFV